MQECCLQTHVYSLCHSLHIKLCPIRFFDRLSATMESLPEGNEETDEIRNGSDGTASCDAFLCGDGLLQTVHVLYFLVVLSASEWRTASDPKQAVWLFSQKLLSRDKGSKGLFLSMDIRQDKEDQDRHLIAFYGRDNIKWTSPLNCKLYGGVTKKQKSHKSTVLLFLVTYVWLFAGDEATGSGVERHMISTVILRLMKGFHLNLGQTTEQSHIDLLILKRRFYC